MTTVGVSGESPGDFWATFAARELCSAQQRTLRHDKSRGCFTFWLLLIFASSEESVGEFWERQVSEVVIKGGFVGVLGSKAVGFSGDQF